ncbi:YqaJ viral recombinase family protein [Mycobacterium sp. PSTR-4-N]|uniref:YqaJ viral recombinase family protein n=1 Tax=Mycobacterium sp. PSTR-4-N TaxID=2917745 RepID=UPI001F154402|nr:YqaJ viral recombinase family protein [Mycobacterium sp. PSTR-4-N]MCG7592436.1 YqaJ viral recombinase family protein [Mycobacterium sp. PSTR-4-N]
MTATLPQCDICTPACDRQQVGEAALWMPTAAATLCAACRADVGLGDTPYIPGVWRRGQKGWIAPGTPEHRAVISPSKVAAILRLSRWESQYRLFHRMTGQVAEEPPQDAFDVGHDLESYAAARWRRKNAGWRLSAGEIQFIIDPNRYGFPVVVTLDRRANRGRAQRVVELKRALTLSDIEQWGDDLTGDLPEDYTAQVTAQMVFTGLTKYDGHLCAIGPYYQDRVYTVPFDPIVGEWITTECAAFWDGVRHGATPELDDSVATYECVRELHPDIDGSTAEVDPDLAIAVHNASADHKDAEKRLRGLKAQLLDAMGDAQYAEFNGIKVATRSPHARGGVALNLARTHPAVAVQKATA